MKRAKLYGGISLAVALASGTAIVLMLLVGVFSSGVARTDASSSAATTDGSDSGFGEGIKVHGDWVIEVRNPDGSVAERREFENALTGNGQDFLAGALGRANSPGVWGVGVRSNVASESPCMTPDPVSLCLIREPISSGLDGYPATHFPTLTVSGKTGELRLTLQGNFDAPNDGIIRRVQTFNCFSSPVNVDPAACNNIQLITETTLATPVNVIAGQQVLVTVRISFS